MGFSLVELLIGLTLGAWLVSSVALTAQRLWLMAHWSADEVELAERGDFALRHLSLALLHAGPMTVDSMGRSPCEAAEVIQASSSQDRTDTRFIEKGGRGYPSGATGRACLSTFKEFSEKRTLINH